MTYHVKVTATSTAPRELIFNHLALPETWSVWGRFPTKSFRERPGTGDPHGVGMVRRIGPAREETVAFDAPSHYAYRLLAGMPVDDYRADVLLAPREGGGTTVRWESRWERRIPGTGVLTRLIMNVMLNRLARGVAAHAEQCKPGCPAYQPATA